MSNNPFIILGISENATQAEITEAYQNKKKYYQELRFEEGEVGADAARMLGVIEQAYASAIEKSHSSSSIEDGPNSYDDVKLAISEKRIDDAQKLLDNNTYRGAEWHYYQAVIYYEKSWLAESKKQLEIACAIDPNNEKYKRTLTNLKKKIDGATPFAKQNQQGQQGQQNYYANRSYQQQPSAGDGCCAACQTLICADCCCECMGGDLIGCC